MSRRRRRRHARRDRWCALIRRALAGPSRVWWADYRTPDTTETP